MSDDFDQRPLAQRGKKIEKLGYLMQQPDATIEDLIQAEIEAGLRIEFGIAVDGRPASDEVKNDE